MNRLLFPDAGEGGPVGPTIRCISLWQPWATLIALGKKRMETRSYSTPYRGLLAIHAAKRWRDDQQAMIKQAVFRDALGGAEIPLGGFVALARIADCKPAIEVMPAADDQAFGDFRAGRFAWQLEDVWSIEFVEASGRQGFWSVPASTFADCTRPCPHCYDGQHSCLTCDNAHRLPLLNERGEVARYA